MPLPAGDLLAGFMKGAAEGLKVLAGRDARKTLATEDEEQGKKVTPEQLQAMQELEELENASD